MNIFADESGSISFRSGKKTYFVIALIHVTDHERLSKAYKRFVSSNYEQLLQLDQEKQIMHSGHAVKHTGKMFSNGKFRELKGVQFDRAMKLKFFDFFLQNRYFDVYYIKLDNSVLPDKFFYNTSRTFNFLVRMALAEFIKKGQLPKEQCFLQMDERNERNETKHFLENYLNAELTLSGVTESGFNVVYFDSADNKFVQIADVFSNLFYSQIQTGQYDEVMERMKRMGMLRGIYEFPVVPNQEKKKDKQKEKQKEKQKDKKKQKSGKKKKK